MATTARTKPSSRMGRRVAAVVLIAGLGTAGASPAMAMDRSAAGKKAAKVALAAVGGKGRVVDVDRERGKRYTWEVEIKNGRWEIDVYLDKNYKVVKKSAWDYDD